ncbi:serine hydrolase [Caulobacter sp. FWC2]|uniref:serine hydrolase n=1 Tax=Caulobacter sp. FWC2 TaxID=69664 RepID=UPI000C154911|nr:serine hydrolase [Caulobacter sp. FWC2]PIB92986.1 serine hydrolase [Caulobacter sp. FWC2]
MKLKILALGAASLLLTSPALAAGQSCPADYAKQARALVDEQVKAGRFSGSVLVAKDGAPLLREGFGAADREWEIPNAPDTKFRLGSLTKQFTATAILQLAEAGKLSIDDPVSKFYADAPAAWSKITIKHLLNHTSGIPSYTGIPGFFENGSSKKPLKPAEIVKLTQDKPLEFEPGSKFAYDNTGYILLGVVIEKVSGQTYADYLSQHIFQPLGMKNTGYDVSAEILAKRASGYQPDKAAWRNADYLDMTLPYAAGSLYSTVDDLLIWNTALTDGKILSDASRKAAWTENLEHYGFGWGIAMQDGHERVSHNGGINGFSTAMNRYPKDGLVTIVLSNFQAAPSTPMANNLAGLCFGTYAAPKAVALSTATLDKYVGSYALSPTFILKVFRDGDKLVTQATGQGPVALVATAPGEFTAVGPDAKLSFKQTGDAPATALVLHQGGRDMEAPRVADKP